MYKLSFEEKLEEFVNLPGELKFKHLGYEKFSDGSNANSWFNSNKKLILNMESDVANKIKNQYREYRHVIEEEIKEKERLARYKNDKFKEFCTIFYNIKDLSKYEENSNVPLVNELLAYSWFNYYKMRIALSPLDICKSIMKEYNEYLKSKAKKEMIDKKRSAQEFYLQKGFNKFNRSSSLTFKNGTSMSSWFYKNFDKIMTSNDQMLVLIKDQYDMYLSINLLKEEFIRNYNLGKYDPDSNVRFKSGALMGDFFISNFDDIASSNNKLDYQIMVDYIKYIMIKDLYYDEEEDLALKKC